MSRASISFVLDADQARERVDKVLARRLAPTSRASIQRWIGEGRTEWARRLDRLGALLGEEEG